VIAASELRTGMAIRVDGQLYKVIAADYHAGGGKLGGVTHAKLRNIESKAVWERRFRADENVEDVEPERQTMQFLYSDDTLSHFMHPETFEQVTLENERLGPIVPYQKPEMNLPVEFFDGKPMTVVFPSIVEVRVGETAAPFHSQGSDNVWKEAKLENGVEIQVPPFIAPGELIRVDVETGTYVERAKAEKKK
jgi:elongation factor P